MNAVSPDKPIWADGGEDATPGAQALDAISVLAEICVSADVADYIAGDTTLGLREIAAILKRILVLRKSGARALYRYHGELLCGVANGAAPAEIRATGIGDFYLTMAALLAELS